MIPGYKKLDEELRFAYYCGASGMWDALKISHEKDDKLTLYKALGKMAPWLDKLRRWGKDEVAIMGVKYFDGYPLPPYVERLPDVD
jgi:hypothetical protein